MIGASIFLIALFMLFAELANLYLENIHHRETIRKLEPEVDIHWIHTPERYGTIEPDWDRILEDTQLASKGRRKA